MAEKEKDTRTPEEKQAHQDLLQAGLSFYNISGIGDTSQIKQQAAGLENYAHLQGIDPENDLNGLTRHVSLFADLVPKEQESAKQKLLELTVANFNYALGGLNGQTAVGLAAKLGTTEAEINLEKTLSTPGAKLEEIKTSFSSMYESSSLVKNYIALNTNTTEVASAAYGAIQRSNQKRQAEFMYLTEGNKVAYNSNKAKTYIAENIEKANKEIAEKVRIGIGSNLASILIAKEQEKTRK